MDLEAFQNSETQMEVGLYNLKKHKVEYFNKSHIDKDETLIKASCALLLLAKPYKFNGEMWMDAGLVDMISIEQSLSLLESLPIIGVDTETEGIDVHTKKLLLAQFGCFDFQIVVDCRTIDITHYKALLERKDKLFLF